ncbi:MAG: hypothetical protein L6R40_007721 [Gallowayella cf. fulva]|nr:MAG: hypothetical protein L6R40_007721 [Xanthomendoza cf. fulva]
MKDSKDMSQIMKASFPSGSTDPREPEPQYVYTVVEVVNNLIMAPTLLVYYEGVFAKLQDALDTAWNRIHRTHPHKLWLWGPQQIPVIGKELLVTAVDADCRLLVVYVEQRPLQRNQMSWPEMDRLILSERP